VILASFAPCQPLVALTPSGYVCQTIKVAQVKRDERGKRVEKGIRIKLGAYVAQLKSGQMQRAKRFPLDMPLHVIRAWRQNTARQLAGLQEARRRSLSTPVLRRSEVSGYCYLYAMQAGQMVKFGRSTDPLARVKELQTNHPLPLSLLVAVPCHASLEPAVHKCFAGDHVSGEWFHATAAVMEFVSELQLGANPVALLWESMHVPGDEPVKVVRPGKKPRRWLADAGPTVSSGPAD
jgi:hypothetical protein